MIRGIKRGFLVDLHKTAREKRWGTTVPYYRECDGGAARLEDFNQEGILWPGESFIPRSGREMR